MSNLRETLYIAQDKLVSMRHLRHRFDRKILTATEDAIGTAIECMNSIEPVNLMLIHAEHSNPIKARVLRAIARRAIRRR